MASTVPGSSPLELGDARELVAQVLGKRPHDRQGPPVVGFRRLIRASTSSQSDRTCTSSPAIGSRWQAWPGAVAGWCSEFVSEPFMDDVLAPPTGIPA
ncbi:MAG: hypothetical protein CMJ47_02105 [Planctomyces sp.]|nr:hypothetical protein [Planctomyces sp.]